MRCLACVILSLWAVACSQADAHDRWSRNRRFRFSKLIAEAIADAGEADSGFDAGEEPDSGFPDSGTGADDDLGGGYGDWLLLYTGEDAYYDSVTGVWTNIGSYDVDPVGSTGTANNVSTSPLTLPSSYTDKGVNLDSNDNWSDSSGFTTIADGQDIHIMIITKLAASLTTNDFIFRYNFGTQDIIQIRAAGAAALGVRALLSNTEAEDSFDVTSYLGTWVLWEWWIDVDDGTTDCGGAACAHNYVRINGDLVLDAQTAQAAGELTGGGVVTLGSYSGGTLNWEQPLLLFGLRPGSYDAAAHNARAANHGF